MEQKRALGSSGQPQEETKIVTMKSVDEELHTFFILASIVLLLIWKYSIFAHKRNLLI